jgi:cellulose synthase/poly-beta-1,6-N-acetylglucosamine synthase-like glycosyltransferase
MKCKVMSAPVVSIVMSVYNGEQFLRESVESILRQSLRDLELIVINDGSTDATTEMLNCYRRKDPRVRVFDQENVGLIESLNRGVSFARGKYIARMDADDIALRDRLSLQVSVLEKHEELAVLGGAIEIINASGMKRETCYFPSKDDEIRSILLQGTCPICHPAVVMRTRAFLSAGGYRKVVVHAEDYDLWLRIADNFRLANLKTVVLKYRRHPGQVSVQRFRQQSLCTLAARIAASSRSRGNPDPLESIQEITPMVLTTLGAGINKQHAAVVRGYLTCIRSMSDAGETTTIRDAIKAMLGSPEWKGAELSLVADFRLLSALILWRQRRYLRSIGTAAHAIVTRPVILVRPLKPILRRLRLRSVGPAL